MQIRLILLDFDGTLADTRRANTLAYVATLREAGYTLTEEEYAAKYFGNSGKLLLLPYTKDFGRITRF